MTKWIWIMLLVMFSSPASAADDEETNEPETTTENSDTGKAKTLSGMSILGNEEAPKSLVIVPWRSSELGEDISLTDSLDNRALPLDKEVFLRELRYYEIRSEEE